MFIYNRNLVVLPTLYSVRTLACMLGAVLVTVLVCSMYSYSMLYMQTSQVHWVNTVLLCTCTLLQYTEKLRNFYHG